ncbi:ABC transporter substrate-binding protein [Paracrocinitomix mangrovi]|uniref:ABC transporter substrate-binding protein n=1 Tax=Paracrocinitomix mangrovi TaxID=2862509 RepID=UPI001C8F182D|nr:ABC transporter substrate-binding protein [Paracrocinitomix mangrovi]UKN00378.1 ABC transporter substrate-binding protein [Paracrocinitomix mangrovi]
MNKLNHILLAGLAAFAFSCGGSSDEGDQTNENSIYGGTFSMPMGSYYQSVRPVEIQKLETAQIYEQVIEGLVKYNPKTLEIEPAIASEWSVSEDGKTYTFTIRDDVYFHDDACFPDGKGRKLVTDDVVGTFKNIYTKDPENRAYLNFKNTVVGGEEFYNQSAQEISGIKVDGQKVNIELVEPSSVFLQKLATTFAGIVPHESLELSEFHPVGTGPFKYDKSSNSELVKLVRNDNFYISDKDGNKLPYLDSVQYKYYEHSEDHMDLFWEGKLSYIPGVPITSVSEVLEERIGDFESDPPKYMLISEPQLSTTYLEFNMNTPVLKNKKVRQALNMAINRKKLVEKIMKNQAYEIGKFGITPPLPKIFTDYDFEGIEDLSYVYNPEEAKKLLAEAGYPNGKNFPTLSFQFRVGNDHYLIASEIQNQLKSALNINIEIEGVEFNKLIENQAMGSADIFRSTWFGDYPNPETFLINAYGGIVPESMDEPSYLNSARYMNPAFDEAYERGSKTANKEESLKAFAEAEKILMEDPPFIILWYGEDLMLLQSDVRDLHTNGMRYLDLRSVYFKKREAKDKEKAEAEEGA